ncbi:TspO/MBR family protein [Chloroflexota bacterium]
MKLKYIYKLIISVVACQGAGLIGSLFTASAIPTWYATLQKPFFTPPNWLFAPAWFTLYLLMGVSASLVWQQGFDAGKVKKALIIFLIQLVINALWSVVFFGFESILSGMVVIIVLWMVILLTILRFYKISALAGTLMLPYILWVTFATVLNVSLFVLNH